MATTTHCEPNPDAISEIRDGFLTAALFSAVGFVGERLEIIQSLMAGPHTFAAMMLAFAAVIVVLALLNAALYFPTRYILKNKLNLESIHP